MSLSQRLSNAIFEYKEKITDSEYINMMNLIKEISINEISEKQIIFTLAIPQLSYNYDGNYGICEKEYHLNYEFVSIKSRLVSCKNNKNITHLEYCSNCKMINDNYTCNILKAVNEYNQGSTINLYFLKVVCVDQFEYINHLMRIYEYMTFSHPVHHHNCEHCEDEETNYIDQPIKITNKIICVGVTK